MRARVASRAAARESRGVPAAPLSERARARARAPVFDSSGPEDDPDHASQQTVWDAVGAQLLDAAWEGFNVSLFAYGQTGSGKSHSMVGFGGGDEAGVVPRVGAEVFARVGRDLAPSGGGDGASGSAPTFAIEVSMMEIYNEKIRDLLVPPPATVADAQAAPPLRVRDAPTTGAYVDGLSAVPVASADALARLLALGTRHRTVAATRMNETSSRAHTVITLTVAQARVLRAGSTVTEARRSARVNLVDLAGSERVTKTGAAGDRLKESGHINQSLTVRDDGGGRRAPFFASSSAGRIL